MRLIKAHHQKTKETTINNNLSLDFEYGLRHLFAAPTTMDLSFDCGLRHLFAAKEDKEYEHHATPSLNHFFGCESKKNNQEILLDPKSFHNLFRKPLGKKWKRVMGLFHKVL